MRPRPLVCLSVILISTMVLAQSDSAPLINQTARVASPVSGSQLSRQRFRAAAHRATLARASGLNFGIAVTYGSAGYYAYSVAVADVNGDGKSDLVVANWCGSGTGGGCTGIASLGVLLGNGDGTFQSAVTYSSGGYYALSVAVADLNGDGKADLVVTNDCQSDIGQCKADGTVGVLLGNGDGTFQTVVNYDSGGYFTHSVAVADINGDGKPDLVVANTGSVQVRASRDFQGNGDGATRLLQRVSHRHGKFL
jgi:FG-GAP-like repeat/FG-GAP repeat